MRYRCILARSAWAWSFFSRCYLHGWAKREECCSGPGYRDVTVSLTTSRMSPRTYLNASAASSVPHLLLRPPSPPFHVSDALNIFSSIIACICNLPGHLCHSDTIFPEPILIATQATTLARPIQLPP